MNGCRKFSRAIAAAALVGVLALSACTNSGGTTDSHDFTFRSATGIGKLIAPAERKKADDFGGSLLAGGRTTLAKRTGKVTVVNFFASWCGPCQVETPQLALLSNATKARGVSFLGIDTHDETSNAKTFVSQSGVRYPVIFDQSGKIALTLGNIPASLPFTVLLDDHERVAAVYVQRFTMQDLKGSIDKLLAES